MFSFCFFIFPSSLMVVMVVIIYKSLYQEINFKSKKFCYYSFNLKASIMTTANGKFCLFCLDSGKIRFEISYELSASRQFIRNIKSYIGL